MTNNITKKSYEDTPYTSKAFKASLPDMQRAVMGVLGFETPKLENARVLEIGCSFGGNILSFAIANPNSECVGIDLSEIQTSEGNRIIESFGIKNLKLYSMNILDYNYEFGKFDYVVVHGVFSWVPDIVKHKILEVIKKSLTENGTATISYNTYPGWKRHEIIRDIMNFRLDYLDKRGNTIREDRLVDVGNGAIEFVSKNATNDNYYKNLIPNILDRNQYYLRHEYLEEYNDPMYIVNFEKMAKEHGLSHITDSTLAVSFPFLGQEIENTLDLECSGDAILKEQYYDYLLNRQFRTSILTHSENREKINISRRIRNSDLNKLYLRPINKFVKNEKGTYANELFDFNETYTKLLDYMNEKYPNFINLGQIVDDLYDEVDEIYSKLVEMIYMHLIDFFVDYREIKKMKNPKIREEYRKYFKYIFENDVQVINTGSFNGNGLGLNLVESFVFSLFDGSRTKDELIDYLIEDSKRKDPIIVINDVNSDEEKRNILKELIEELIFFAEKNLLN